MLKSVEGIYREGKIELLERPGDIKETRVIVTFLPPRKGGSPATSVHARRIGGSTLAILIMGGRLECPRYGSLR
jgi:hypothetical protein